MCRVISSTQNKLSAVTIISSIFVPINVVSENLLKKISTLSIHWVFSICVLSYRRVTVSNNPYLIKCCIDATVYVHDRENSDDFTTREEFLTFLFFSFIGTSEFSRKIKDQPKQLLTKDESFVQMIFLKIFCQEIWLMKFLFRNGFTVTKVNLKKE